MAIHTLSLAHVYTYHWLQKWSDVVDFKYRVQKIVLGLNKFDLTMVLACLLSFVITPCHSLESVNWMSKYQHLYTTVVSMGSYSVYCKICWIQSREYT